MSDECGDKSAPETNQQVSCPVHCYWVSQGQCFLNTLPECDVFRIIKQSPVARDAVATCVDLGCCEAPSQRVLDFAQEAQTVQSSQELSDDFQRRINTPYRDNTPYIGPGVFRNPSEGDS